MRGCASCSPSFLGSPLRLQVVLLFSFTNAFARLTLPLPVPLSGLAGGRASCSRRFPPPTSVFLFLVLTPLPHGHMVAVFKLCLLILNRYPVVQVSLLLPLLGIILDLRHSGVSGKLLLSAEVSRTPKFIQDGVWRE